MNIKRLLPAAAFLAWAGPALAVPISGSATRISFIDANGNYGQAISTRTGNLVIQLVDDYGVPASTSVAVTVLFESAYLNWDATQNIPGAVQFTSDNFVSSATFLTSPSITIPSGATASTIPFRVAVATVTGTVALKARVSGGPLDNSTAFYTLNVLGNLSFTGVSIRNGTDAVSTSSATMTPDRDGVRDSVVIRGSVPGIDYWEVIISSADATPVRRLYGYGSPPEVAWFGNDDFGRVVSNGVYGVRLQTYGGAIQDQSLSVSVNSGYITGKVEDSQTVSPLGNARVNAYGPGGGGFARTDDNGDYALYGLKMGDSYGLQINCDADCGGGTTYVPVSSSSIPAGSTGRDFLLKAGVELHVAVQRSTSSSVVNPELWAYLSANTTDYAQNAYGAVHFQVNVSTSDNGDYYNSSTFTKLSVPPAKTINLRLEVPRYGVFTRQVTSPAVGGPPLSVLFSSTEVVKLPTVSGNLVLSTPSASGVWVSVQGKKGTAAPSVFGGVYVSSGTSIASYEIFGVSTGSWTFQTYAPGYVSASSATAVTADKTINFSIDTGGVLVGTITLSGDSSGAQASQGGSSCAAGSIPVNFNAWSPSSFTGAWTSVCVTTGTNTTAPFTLSGLEDGTYEVYAQLPGFQLNPLGRRIATVTGGVGSLNQPLTFVPLSGGLVLPLTLPSPTDPTKVGYQVQSAFGGGPDSFSRSGSFPAGGTKTFSGMGTGLYSVSVQNFDPASPSYGLVKRAAVAVVNGSTATLPVDLTASVFSVSGAVTLDGNLVLSAPWGLSGAGVTVSSAAGLSAAVTPLGSTAPVVQVFSFPLPEHFHGSVNPYTSVPAAPVAGQNHATFTVPGLTPGTYLLRVRDDLDNLSGDQQFGLPEFATTNQVIFVGTAGVSGTTLTLTNGVDVYGDVTASGDTQTRLFELMLRRSDNLVVFQSTISMTAGTFSYRFQHVSDGDYTLEVRERTWPPQYVAEPQSVRVAGGAVQKNVTLLKAGAIVGRLRDADSNTLITGDNQSQYLPDNFAFYARANPWTPGGHGDMARGWEAGQSNGNVYLSTAPGQEGQFMIPRLIPGNTFDVSFRGFESFSGDAAAKGQKTYVPLVYSGLRVEAGQTVDLGTVDLRQGVALSGKVTLAGSTTPLSNVAVVAYPSQLDGSDRHDLAVRAYTDQDGHYVLQGVDRVRRYYDVTAAPRDGSGSVGSLLEGTRYGQEMKRNVDSSLPANRTGLDFSLTAADGRLSGTVTTVDGGPLQKPFGDRGGGLSDRKASLVLHREGAVNVADNPIGEIEAETDALGNFTVEGLRPGIYTVKAFSIGYTAEKRTLVVNSGNNGPLNMVLRRGAALSGSLSKPDGTSPSTDEVSMVVGVDRDFQEFVFARLKANEDTNEVTGYQIDGFKTGITYSLVAVNEEDDIIQMSTVSFSASTETKVLDLVYRPSPPSVFVTQSRSGDDYHIRFFSTHKLRNLTEDDSNLRVLVTTAAPSAGSIDYDSTGTFISPSRDAIEVVYTAAPNESSFSLNLAFTGAKVDAETGDNFTYGPTTFTFYAGIDRSRIVRIANTVGGECSLEGSAAGGEFPPGVFDVGASSTVEVGVLGINVDSPDDAPGAFAASLTSRKARALGAARAARRLGAAAYPARSIFQAALAAPDVGAQVFSNFYNVFLPAGVSHTLKKDALITLKYEDGVDPEGLNVYYFDPGNNVYLLESAQRQVDTENRTITVAVRHLSTFVVINGNASVIGAGNFAGDEIAVHNFPNPFNLKPKTLTLNDAAPTQTLTTEGTVIKCALPAGKSGSFKIEIFDAAGQGVRTISGSAPAGGSYYYVEWDGKNDAGKKVASGVYLGRFTLGDGDEKFFKLAVLK